MYILISYKISLYASIPLNVNIFQYFNLIRLVFADKVQISTLVIWQDQNLSIISVNQILRYQIPIIAQIE